MKFIHLSDLHIGKRVNEFSMIEDQKYIFNQIYEIIDRVQPDGIIIAGDVYDKTTPSEEAVRLLNEFICTLAEKEVKTYIISGNHDSAERLAFGAQLIGESGIYISPVYNGETVKYTLTDSFGDVDIYMLPFIKPAHVRRYYPDAEIANYTDAVEVAVKNMNVDTSKRNVIITHQFVTGADRSDSEELSVGGSDNVDVSVFDCFDYVALGHIHGPQKMTRETVRYCGTPLKYSFSEANHKKSVTIVEMLEKGNVTITTEPLAPLRDMRVVRGSYNDIAHKANYENTNRDDYIQIILTDEEDVPDAIGRLRVIYPNIMHLKYDNKRTQQNVTVGSAEDVENKSPLELFSEFYTMQNNQPMSEKQAAFINELIGKIWEDNR
ncbi:MAG: exonuclease SbcCD subunit D [Ruminococcaceae bacterium]|nr:exonuclease SbcCD subunit D [Oscillospiraceae bacterium]